MSPVKLIIDGARLAELTRGPSGPVWRHLVERATMVQSVARTRCPVKTGTLRDSIVKRAVEETSTGLGIRVVATAKYALFVHEGTTPHVIYAKNSSVLAFNWPNGPNGPGVYFFKQVNHPGTKAVPFLRDALPVAIHA